VGVSPSALFFFLPREKKQKADPFFFSILKNLARLKTRPKFFFEGGPVCPPLEKKVSFCAFAPENRGVVLPGQALKNGCGLTWVVGGGEVPRREKRCGGVTRWGQGRPEKRCGVFFKERVFGGCLTNPAPNLWGRNARGEGWFGPAGERGQPKDPTAPGAPPKIPLATAKKRRPGAPPPGKH